MLYIQHRLDDDMASRHNVTITNQSQVKSQAINSNDPFFRNTQDSHHHHHQQSPYNSAPSSPRTSNGDTGHVTPPPNTRSHKRTSTPPGANSISRTNSRHSKSSSDGSWDTPAPSSPHSTNAKPPHARSAPISKSRRKISSDSSGGNNDGVVEDLSEAFYAKSWMCGFADAFNFDGFDKFQK